LKLAEAVERGHRPAQRARRRAEEPADPRPEAALADPLQEAELEQEPVHPPAGEDDRHVPLSRALHRHLPGARASCVYTPSGFQSMKPAACCRRAAAISSVTSIRP